MSGPISQSYWVEPGRLAAGEYPGSPVEEATAAKLAAFQAAGVTSFLDLTEDGELLPYEALLQGLRWIRLPVRDADVPTIVQMREILDRIDAELARHEVAYVHCWGGRGRTGTVVACWLVRHGMSAENALQRIEELRRPTPDASMPSPEFDHQRQFVHSWLRNDPDALLVHAAQAALPCLESRAADHQLGEIRDLHREMVAALDELVDERRGNVPVPHWPHVGNLDLAVAAAPPQTGLLLAAEEKWDKLDEQVWDLFKMALLATSPLVAATFLVSGVTAKDLDGGFCSDLVETGRHSVAELCSRAYPNSTWLLWDWMLHGGHDHYPERVPLEIETRLLTASLLEAADAELRVLRVLPVKGTPLVEFSAGWPNGQRPPDARHPLIAAT